MTIQAVKGTRDVLPAEIPLWRRVEEAARELFARYGYREIRTPVFEQTELFARGIGGETDIVSKEMYSFEDRGGESLTLRPEATAGIVRAVIEHNLAQADPLLKVWAMGPMFRAENVQRGRYRQFHQIDVEAFGITAPSLDAELVEMAVGFLDACGVRDHEVVLNSVGDAACRPAYVETLRQALRANLGRLSEDSRRRAETNPLRVLDSKAPEDQPVVAELPRILDHLCEPCREHFAEVRRQLDLLGVRYRVDHRLVRGLDYYVRTTFEITSGALGAQNSVLGGGRYDGLVAELGGGELPGIGFALGLERLVMMLAAAGEEPRCDVFVASLVKGDAARAALDKALLLQRALRESGLRVVMDHEGRSFKARMKLADKLGARFVAILGDDELQKGVWAVRDMRGSSQETLEEARLVEELRARLRAEAPAPAGGEKANG
jgi:histidyl-tRNA synthetase